MELQIIKVKELKSEVKCDLWGLWGHLEAAMASEATKMAVIGNVQMDTKDIVEVIEHHMPISHSPCRRRSIGPLPSCSIIFMKTVALWEYWKS